MNQISEKLKTLTVMIKMEMLRCFVTVARSGNLSDAAETLGRTPSAVSMMLKQFEAHLGHPLFQSDRKNKMTPLGTFVFDEACREVEHFERTVAVISDFAKAKSGMIRMAAVPSVAGSILPVAINRFSSVNPDVTFDVRDMDSASIHRELLRERIDFGLASTDGSSVEIEGVRLISDTFGIVCRADHPLNALPGPVRWQDLEGVGFIKNGLCHQITAAPFQAIAAASKLTVHNTTSLLALVRRGAGVTVVPKLVVNGSDTELVFLEIADTTVCRSIDVLRRADTRVPPVAERFLEEVRRAAEEVAASY